MSSASSFVRAAVARALRPDPVELVSQWADKHRFLSRQGSAEQGQYRTSRTPYMREPMDRLSPADPCQKVVFKKAARVGFTEAANNLIGYVIHRAPGPILMAQPTFTMAEDVSTIRIAPMIAASPVLSDRVAAPRSKDATNKILQKDFPGGQLQLIGVNSPNNLREKTIRYLICDEVDAWKGEVGQEGDPLRLLEKRTATYGLRKKVLIGSNPTVKDFSRIDREFLRTDQRRYFIPCPHCGHMDWIQWRIGGWSGKEGRHHHIYFEERRPETACLVCSSCDAKIPERFKTAMLAKGVWRPTSECADPRVAGYHISGLYSPVGWLSWADCVEEFLEAKDDPSELRVFVNTVLGEVWQDSGESADTDVILGRAAAYPGEVPIGVGILVAAVDVQGDRLECKVKGYGAGEESWLIAYQVIPGDPGQDRVWLELDTFLRSKFTHENGQHFRIERVTIDSGGHHTEHVYRFVQPRAPWVVAIKGSSTKGEGIVKRMSRRNSYKVPVFSISTDTAKDVIYSRLCIIRPGPGYMNFPDWIDQDYVDQLTAERLVKKYVPGRGVIRTWQKIKGHERNEALDLEVYCLAALYIGGLGLRKSLGERATRWARKAEDVAAAKAAPRPPRPAPRRGWVNRWRP